MGGCAAQAALVQSQVSNLEGCRVRKFNVTLQLWLNKHRDMQAALEEAARKREVLHNPNVISAVAMSAKGYDLYPRFLAGDKTVRKEDFPIRCEMVINISRPTV